MATHSDSPPRTMVFLSLLPSRTAARWVASEFSELPVFDHGDSQPVRDWRLLAGGLALLLSRCSQRGAKRDFPASLQAYRFLRLHLKDSAAAARLPLRVLSDLRHEIAGVADAATCEAARRCMERQLARTPRH